MLGASRAWHALGGPVRLGMEMSDKGDTMRYIRMMGRRQTVMSVGLHLHT